MRTNYLILPRVLAMAALALLLISIQPVPAATWVTYGPLITARYNHTATLLSNGRVLVAGGWNDSYLASAELYDPATGRWTPTGALTTNRCYHTATLLPNGKVLVAGGRGNDAPYDLSSAELYDPVTGTWSATNPMHTTHVFHTATLLANGKVLVTGGISTATELYDPATGTWTASGTMKRARWYHTATLLPDGRVLVAGGDYGNLPSAEVYDPVTEMWTSTVPMTTYRESPSATLLPNGQVLVAGGWQMIQVQTNPPAYTSISLSSAEFYDPATGSWTATTNTMMVGRNSHTASLLPNGQVLLAGGFESGPGELASVEVFDPAAGAWIASTNALNGARWSHTATLLPSGRILVAGGIGHNGVTNSTELYDPANGTWTAIGALPTSGYLKTTVLPNGNVLVTGIEVELYNAVSGTWTATNSPSIPRYEHTATLLPNGKVLFAGGATNNHYYPNADLFDPATGSWTATSPLAVARFQHTATLLPNGNVLVAGGGNGSLIPTSLKSAELYNPVSGTWKITGSLNTARLDHTATLLTNGKVLVTGGSINGSSRISSAELYDPATGTWTTTGALHAGRDAHTATLLPNGKVLVAGGYDFPIQLSSAELYDPATGAWTETASMTMSRFMHAANLLPNGEVLVAGGGRNISSASSAELYDPVAGRWTATGPLTTGSPQVSSALLPNGKVLIVGSFSSTNNSAELYDVGLGFSASWQPQIAMVTSPLSLGGSLSLTGSGFRGTSSGSGGTTQDSSSGVPVVQLRSLESGQTAFLLATNWQTNSFTSAPVWGFPPGYALATVFVNGISSTGSVVNISVPVPTATTLTDAKRLTNGAFQFAFTNNVGAQFGVLAATNPTLPSTNWTPLGGVTEVTPGQFQFTDPQATNSSSRFYRLRSP